MTLYKVENGDDAVRTGHTLNAEEEGEKQEIRRDERKLGKEKKQNGGGGGEEEGEEEEGEKKEKQNR